MRRAEADDARIREVVTSPTRKEVAAFADTRDP
jgi:hypothetical protein